MKAELLSPAGNPEIFKSVVDAGADAVYFGGERFGARAYAENFSLKDGEKCISYAHVRGRKAYLTVNTLLKNPEMENELYEYLKGYYEAGIDAFIVQDMGVFSLIRECFPDVHIHASTQMTVANKYGAGFLKELGADRVVTAREMSLRELKELHEYSDIEIETFVHGALCICYSGQCLMSSVIGGRSGNRGRCAQPCRLPYKTVDTDNNKGDYILSPKDYSAIDHLPEMLDAGVFSFKIEGRMKQKEYASGVTQIYRKYLDMALESTSDIASLSGKVSREDHDALLTLGNRCGFTDAYLYERNSTDMISFTEPSHKTGNAGLSQPDGRLPVKAAFTATNGKPVRLSLSFGGRAVEVFGKETEKSLKRATTAEEIKEKLMKMGDTEFSLKATDINIDIPDDIFIPMSEVNRLRREAADKLTEALYENTDNKPRRIYPKSELNSNRDTCIEETSLILVTAETKEQLDILLQYDEVTHIGISAETFSHHQGGDKEPVSLIHEAKKKAVSVFPPVLRGEFHDLSEDYDLYLISSLDEAGFLEGRKIPKDRIIFSERLYTYSDRTLKAYRDMGYRYFTAPYELNKKELSHRDNNGSFMNIYSYIPLMETANCTHKNLTGCDGKRGIITVKDRQNKSFYIKNYCHNCYNIIYNGLPYEIMDKKEELLAMGFMGFKIDLTIESGPETKRIMDALRYGGRPFPDRTGGHYTRGVQ